MNDGPGHDEEPSDAERAAPANPVPDLGSLREVRALLARHGLMPDRSLGQSFLVDRRALAAVVEAADPPADAHVLEVGPGLGTLTRALAERVSRVTAVEIDARLLPALRETTDAYTGVEVVHQDALRFPHEQLPHGSLLVSNLPYAVATALLQAALASGRYRRMVVLVQREVAERITAGPGDPAFGAFSLICHHYADARIVRTVSPGCFHPPPKVTSAVVRLDVRPDAAPDPDTFALIRDGFRHRRKTLRNNLIAAGWPDVREALREPGLPDGVRAEALDLAAWRRLRAILARHDPESG